MNKEERIKQLNASFDKRMEEEAKKHPDIKILLDSYKKIKKDSKFSKEFLDGYLSCISDLVYVKKMV